MKPIVDASRKWKSNPWKSRIGTDSSLFGSFHCNVKASSLLMKKSDVCPPIMAAIPENMEFITEMLARDAVAFFGFDSFAAMFPIVRFVPAIDKPINTCIITSRGRLSRCFCGKVVKVHAKMQIMNMLLLTVSTGLFPYLSDRFPRVPRKYMLDSWLITVRIIIWETEILRIFSMYTVKNGEAMFTAKLHNPIAITSFLKFLSLKGCIKILRYSFFFSIGGSGIREIKYKLIRPISAPNMKREEYP